MSAMEIVVRHVTAEDHAEWTRMRVALWPENSVESHAEEIAASLSGNLAGCLAGLHAVAVFVAVRPDGSLCGFLEASVRPVADGCTTHPVGYGEGWYLDPDVRQKGVGRTLLEAAERCPNRDCGVSEARRTAGGSSRNTSGAATYSLEMSFKLILSAAET
jgi:hypothetical protein